MPRRLFPLLSAASVLLYTGVCALCVPGCQSGDTAARSDLPGPGTRPARPDTAGPDRGDRPPDSRPAGALSATGPVAAAAAADEPRERLRRVRNGDLTWVVAAADPEFREILWVSVVPGGPARDLRAQYDPRTVNVSVPDAAGRVPILLDAPGDPDRFVAAHYGLTEIERGRTGGPAVRVERRPGGAVRVWYDGLVVDLQGPSDPRVDSSDTHFADYAATADPGQMPGLRERWLGRLGRPTRTH